MFEESGGEFVDSFRIIPYGKLSPCRPEAGQILKGDMDNVFFRYVACLGC